jgi:RNA-directed DNA polymerase
MMESRMTRNCHVRFGEKDEETHKSRDLEVRFVPTPLSPLLANIGLHGLKQLINAIKLPKDKWENRLKLNFVRYADDFIITSRDKENLENALIQIKQWLSERGLEISEEKTRIVHLKDEFNFGSESDYCGIDRNIVPSPRTSG